VCEYDAKDLTEMYTKVLMTSFMGLRVAIMGYALYGRQNYSYLYISDSCDPSCDPQHWVEAVQEHLGVLGRNKIDEAIFLWSLVS